MREKEGGVVNDDFHYEVTRNWGTLSTSGNGWSLELKSISWNGRPEKYDIRAWSPDKSKMGKGVTLTRAEIVALRDLLNSMSLEPY